MDLGSCTFEEVWTIAEKIEGWLNPEEARLLYDTAKKTTGKGAIVEIGSWCSKSITYMAAGALSSNNGAKFFCIDPFLTSKDEPNGKYDTFISNLKKHGLFEKVTHIKEKSQIAGESFDEKIELLFIDGFHQYDFVKKDFELFYPHIVEGGYVIIHDVAFCKGPTELVRELVATDLTYKLLAFECSAVLAQKVSNLTEEDKLQNKKLLDAIEHQVSISGELVP